MKKRRLLAWLMTLVMMIGLMPATALAAETNLTPPSNYYKLDGTPTDATTAANSGITLSKKATPKADGTYDIELSVKTTQTIQPKPTEVVFVLDASGSMNYCTAENGFVEHQHDTDGWDKCNYNSTQETCDFLKRHTHVHTWNKNDIAYCTWVNDTDSNTNNDSRWKDAKAAIATMKSTIGTANITYSYVYFQSVKGNNDNWTNVANTVTDYSQVSPGGGTPLTLGISKGLQQFTNNDTNKALIIVADGAADGNNYTVNGLQNWKADVDNTVYTVGFTFSDSRFAALASDGCNYTAENAKQLNVAMQQIAQKIAGMINDPMGDFVDFSGTSVDDVTVNVDGGTKKYNESTDTITWTDDEGITNKTVTMTYDVKLDTDNTAVTAASSTPIYLNGNATLNYSYTSGNQTITRSIAFPKPVVVADTSTLEVNYKWENGTSVDNGKYDTYEWIMLPGDFTTTVPAVGTQYKDTGLWVTAVNAQKPENPTVQNYARMCLQSLKLMITKLQLRLVKQSLK